MIKQICTYSLINFNFFLNFDHQNLDPDPRSVFTKNPQDPDSMIPDLKHCPEYFSRTLLYSIHLYSTIHRIWDPEFKWGSGPILAVLQC